MYRATTVFTHRSGARFPDGNVRYSLVLLCSQWIAGLLTLSASLLLRNPLLLPWRETMMVLVFVLPCIPLTRMLLRRRLPRESHACALLLLWIVSLIIAMSQQGEFLWHRYRVQHSDDPPARQLGEHLVIGYSDANEVRRLAERGLIGGVFIGANNVRKRSTSAIREEITSFQEARKAAGLPPLIVATDQEGGIVSRVSPPLPQMPSLAEVIATARPDEIEALAFAYGKTQGHDLAGLGINVNFAPLADLSSPDRRQRFDFRSQIGQRAIASDPARVSPAVVGYAHGLESAGVHATLKHFPGLGRVKADTHIFPAALATEADELEGSDWLPFRHGLRNTRSLLMVGHATLSTVDDEKPASLSRKVIDDIVRRRWGHDGVLITDDLSMGAVVRHGLCAAGTDAINAGVDLLLVSYDTAQYYTILHCLLRAAESGALDTESLANSRKRLSEMSRN